MVDPDLLHNAYSVSTQNTDLAKSTLNIKTELLKARCKDCDLVAEFELNSMQCEHCGSFSLQILSGDELLIKSIDFFQ